MKGFMARLSQVSRRPVLLPMQCHRWGRGLATLCAAMQFGIALAEIMQIGRAQIISDACRARWLGFYAGRAKCSRISICASRWMGVSNEMQEGNSN